MTTDACSESGFVVVEAADYQSSKQESSLPSLQKRIDQSAMELAAVRNELQEARAQQEDTAAKMAALEAELLAQQMRNKEFAVRFEEERSIRTELEQERDNSVARETLLAQAQCDLEMKLKALIDGHQTLANRVGNEVNNVKMVEAAHLAEKAKLAQCQQELASCRQEFAAAANTAQKRAQEIELGRTTIARLEAAAATHANELLAKQQEIQQLQTALATENAAVQELRCQTQLSHKAVDSRMQDVMRLLNNRAVELDQLRQEHADLSNAHHQLAAVKDAIEGDLQSAQVCMDELIREAQRAKDQHSDVENTLRMMTQEFRAEGERQARQLEAKNPQIAALKAELAQLRAAHAQPSD